MSHFDFPSRFRTIYEKAFGLYQKGQRGPETFFTADEQAWLAANGLTAQNLYDYAEDHNNYGGEPGLLHALAIECVRRDYFLNVQNGRASGRTVDSASFPSKTEAARGVSWLPRLLPKARAKLRGELPSSLMYCCGGDRAFFKEHDLLPAEFLATVWRSGDDDAAVVDWFFRRKEKNR